MTELHRLLDLQLVDTGIDQLRHRRDALAERTELAARREALAEVEKDIETISGRRFELSRSQQRLEDEVAAIEAKAAAVDRTLYSGAINAPRELQALQDELGALGRRQRALEDDILELMEQGEPIDAELARLAGQRDVVDADAVRLTAVVAEAEVAIDTELAELESRRVELAAAVPPDLLAEYERLRSRLGGIGVAPLVGNSCGGCHLTLPAVEIDSIRRGAAGERVHCSECSRLLVTASR